MGVWVDGDMLFIVSDRRNDERAMVVGCDKREVPVFVGLTTVGRVL